MYLEIRFERSIFCGISENRIIATYRRRSVKEAIEIVEDISKIETRQTVLDSVPYISNKIIAQFAKEVKITDQIFGVSINI